MIHKVFCIGFNKTGTVSIYNLFLSWGFRSYHGTDWNTLKNIKLFEEYDCFLDGHPYLQNLKKIDSMFPNSNFILTVRNLDEWIASRLTHIQQEKHEGIWKFEFKTWDDTDFAISEWVKNRNSYHLDVLNYFKNRPDDFLVINYPKDELAANKIANFLGYKGHVKKLHCNQSLNNLDQYQDRIYQVLGNIDLKNDLFNY